jgi:hypothetical protein
MPFAGVITVFRRWVAGHTSAYGIKVAQRTLADFGAIPGVTSGGGTNGFVSADAMQEFSIQTSPYPTESGRAPSQVSIVTKSAQGSLLPLPL